MKSVGHYMLQQICLYDLSFPTTDITLGTQVTLKQGTGIVLKTNNKLVVNQSGGISEAKKIDKLRYKDVRNVKKVDTQRAEVI